MVELLLLAQLAGPRCGWNYGADITPENSPYVGCVVPSKTDPGGTRLRQDMFSPSGVRAEPASRDWLVPADR